MSRFDSTSEDRGKGGSKVKFHLRVHRGKECLRSENPNPEDDSWYLIGSWLSLPNIGEELIGATIAVMSTETAATRRATHCELRYGFIRFLNEMIPDACLQDLNTSTFREFVEWLDATKPDGKPKHGYYGKLHKLSCLKKVIGRISSKLTALGIDHEFPVNPWPGQGTQKPIEKKTISQQYFIDLLSVSIDAYKVTIEEIGPLLSMIDRKVENKTPSYYEDINTLAGLCAAIIIRYDGVLPEREWLKENDIRFFEAVEVQGYMCVARIINPKINDLIPGFIILQCFTHWNDQPLCCLAISNIEKKSGVLGNKYKISSHKNRSRKKVFRSFAKGPEIFNPCNVIDFIESWTRYIRLVAPDNIKNYLFLFVSKFKRTKVGAIRSFAQGTGGLYKEVVDRKIKFFQERKVVPAGGAALRQAGSDYLRDLLKDSEKVKVLLGHSSVTTTDENYRSAEARRRDELTLAGAMTMKERHQGSGGKIDPRGHYEDRSAATPGYRCLDPFQSPVPGQRPGQMCMAYGLCPSCPLSASRSDDVSWGRKLQLRQRYQEAVLSMGTVRFSKRYGESAEALDRSLERLSDVDLSRIRGLILNPIPAVE